MAQTQHLGEAVPSPGENQEELVTLPTDEVNKVGKEAPVTVNREFVNKGNPGNLYFNQASHVIRIHTPMLES